ncbi:phosphoglycerol transferase MdoB-like AlkP superfamily enzyme [Evansella vedderi]|uniref:Phosphoglycerol transferase MdoB-like AlkP superfamily enzyme n=1 Tax=Evansella vedderi TaxID=38282 RepID=A0ABT9ZRI8_9BACI|nr:LTA synthase family protein [Evansella vedderi]MDQ0253073.1 phosphoglycerol transferase MdoB-like AlkP superfamily enzyme [Evansella vedderi]
MKTKIREHRFLFLCLLVVWLKTFIVSGLTFYINMNEMLQGLAFAINPLLFLFILFTPGVFFREKFQPTYYLVISILLSVVLYSNIVYHREFSDIITLPMLLMGANMGDLTTSIFALIEWYDILYFIDIFLISFFVWRWEKFRWLTTKQVSFRQSKTAVFTLFFLLFIIFAQFKTLDAAYTFNRNQLVQTLGLFNYYIYDAIIHTQTRTQPIFSEEGDWDSIIRFLQEKHVEPNREMFGIAEGMNVIVVSLESVESFVIGETLHGEEITPFLNELIEDSFYFDNFYYQTGQGKTSDAEFLINNSLYPLGRGAVFLTHDDNKFRTLPETLFRNGYSTNVFHANYRTFYNRDVMYPNLGYEQYYSFSYFDISTKNSVGWGLKDIDFIEQSMEYLVELSEPFYSTFITLTNHFPYDLDEEDHFIEPFYSESHIVNQYFPTVRYTDEAMRIFVERLKETGLYENTVLVMYGDHYGLAESQYDALGQFLGKEITVHDAVKLERVPLIIHIPGLEGATGTMSTVSGQVDVMPTLLNLLGIEEMEGAEHIMFGSDLFAEDREDFVVLRDGTVITDGLIYTNEMCLKSETGESVPLRECEELRERGMTELNYSDKIIYGDLLRFK